MKFIASGWMLSAFLLIPTLSTAEPVSGSVFAQANGLCVENRCSANLRFDESGGSIAVNGRVEFIFDTGGFIAFNGGGINMQADGSITITTGAKAGTTASSIRDALTFTDGGSLVLTGAGTINLGANGEINLGPNGAIQYTSVSQVDITHNGNLVVDATGSINVGSLSSSGVTLTAVGFDASVTGGGINFISAKSTNTLNITSSGSINYGYLQDVTSLTFNLSSSQAVFNPCSATSNNITISANTNVTTTSPCVEDVNLTSLQGGLIGGSVFDNANITPVSTDISVISIDPSLGAQPATPVETEVIILDESASTSDEVDAKASDSGGLSGFFVLFLSLLLCRCRRVTR
jgi:hypothetical protein